MVESGRDRKQLKILDFGVAKKQGAEASLDSRFFDAQNNTATSTTTGLMGLTTPGSTFGTAAYMSPEQAKGDPLDSRTDLFSLGSVLYEMATGRPPFGDRSTAGVFAALLTKDPPPVSSLNPAMPSALDSIIAKLLAKDRDQRYRSAEELLADLEAFSASASSSPAATGPVAVYAAPPAPVPPPRAAGRRPSSPLPHARHRRLAAGGIGRWDFSVPPPSHLSSTQRRRAAGGKARGLERQHHCRRLYQQNRRPRL